jgi:uncharacterized membrane protein
VTDSNILAVLLFGHILSAMGWLGGGILTTFVVGPGLRGLSPASNIEFTAKVMPKILRFVQIMIGSTLLFGVLLYLYLGFTPSFGGANTLYAGIGLALVTTAIVFSLTVPSFRKVIKMAQERLDSGAQGPPPPEMMKYGKRARQGSLIGVALMLIVLATMIGATLGI